MSDEYEVIVGYKTSDALVPSRIGILPIGSLEYHGPHLPLGTDCLIAAEIARSVARDLNAVLFPALYFTSEYWTKGFPGTISIEGGVFVDYVAEVLRGILRSGLGGVLMLSAHGENAIYCPEAGRLAAKEFPDRQVMFINWWDPIMDYVFSDGVRFIGEHGGFEEGSVLAHIAPDRVDTSKASDRDYVQPWAPLRVISPPSGKLSQQWHGYWGRIHEISKEKGEIMMVEASRGIVEVVRDHLQAKPHYRG